MLVGAVSLSGLVLAVHILAVVIGFGAIFAYPLLFAAAGRVDPSVTPWLLRTRQRVGRYLVNPGLLVILLAGIYLATSEHQWSSFYVQWGIAAVLVMGAIEGTIMIPRTGRLADLAERELAATAVAAGGQRVSATWSRKYSAGRRTLVIASAGLELIVVVTVFLMATHAGR